MEEHPEVKHPRECIADYCLLKCEKKERRNSKRSVSECLTRTCPLWPYRTGKLKWEKPEKDPSEAKQRKRIQKLRMARRKAENAENALKRAQEEAKTKEQICMERRERLNEAKQYVLELENAFYTKEDPDGLWR